MGRAVAECFAEEGANVGMCARGADALRTAAEGVAARGVRVAATPADLSTPGAGRAAVEHAAAQLGRLDAVVVNAGGPPHGTFIGLDDSAWDAAYRLTFMSAVELVRAALPFLESSDAASIVFIASWSVRQPIRGLTLSNSIRGATAGLAKSLADELAPAVRVNTILPGTIRTDRQLEPARSTAGSDLEAHFRAMAGNIPLARIGEPAEVARATVFLSSPAASYVTGQMLAVDGGVIRSVT